MASEVEVQRRLLRREETSLLRTLTQVRERINALAPISSLPPEILTHIFLLHVANAVDLSVLPISPSALFDSACLSDSRFLQSITALELSSVCRLWRNVALNCAALWMNVTITYQSNPAWTALQLSRSKNMPFALTLLKHARVDAVLSSLTRVQGIDLVCDIDQDILQCLVDRAPLLQHLIFSGFYDSRVPLQAVFRPESSPHLYRVEVYTQIPLSVLPAHTLRHLVINNTMAYTSSLVDVLETMPLLEHMELCCKFGDWDRAPYSITLGSIRILHVACCDDSLPVAFLDSIVLPNLTTFSVGSPSNASTSLMAAFVSKLSPFDTLTIMQNGSVIFAGYRFLKHIGTMVFPHSLAHLRRPRPANSCPLSVIAYGVRQNEQIEQDMRATLFASPALDGVRYLSVTQYHKLDKLLTQLAVTPCLPNMHALEIIDMDIDSQDHTRVTVGAALVHCVSARRACPNLADMEIIVLTQCAWVTDALLTELSAIVFMIMVDHEIWSGPDTTPATRLD
ncbi:uncharacterized protein FIBRA_03123 [Fibroporia radiculosa]|uniref:F-box domain-containing protein n=1 Tax=Fibroporia radiculosa TaxID=599839 RepID=J4GNB0_9APHY|nr:uncharacterized protein FIBRA_03123 [Fibroporia radiculosa]CCM01075.1 predicted protein [Fibroporia radiculosa]